MLSMITGEMINKLRGWPHTMGTNGHLILLILLLSTKNEFGIYEVAVGVEISCVGTVDACSFNNRRKEFLYNGNFNSGINTGTNFF